MLRSLLLLVLCLGTALTQPQYNYAELTKSPYFVDKSPLLYVLFGNFSTVHDYISTPKSFGRTVTLDMIYFFANVELDLSNEPKPYNTTASYQVFTKLSIGQNDHYRNVLKEHLAQHPVIYMSLGDNLPKKFSVQSIMKFVTYSLQKSFKQYQWLVHLNNKQLNRGPNRTISKEDINFVDRVIKGRLNQASILESLKTLARVLYKYFNRQVVILIDSYDNALKYALFYSKIEIQDDAEMYDALMLINKMVSNAVRFASYTKSIITGVTNAPLDQEHLSCLVEYNFLRYHLYTKYIGYTEDEVDALLLRNGCPMQERNAVVRHYNGYKIEDGETKVFSPHSITEYLKNRINDTTLYTAGLKTYFLNNEKVSPVLKFASIPVFRHSLVSLVNSIPVTFPPLIHFERLHFQQYYLLRNKNYTFAVGYCESFAKSLLLTMTLRLGYLGYTYDRNFTLPNIEIEDNLASILDTYYKSQNVPFKEIGLYIYDIIDTMDDTVKEGLLRDLESKLTSVYRDLSIIYDYTSVSELEYRYIINKSIKKHHEITKNKGSVWTSGKEIETILVTSKANNKTSAGVIQLRYNCSATATLARAMKYIRPRVGKAPVTYFGIGVDPLLNVAIEITTSAS